MRAARPRRRERREPVDPEERVKAAVAKRNRNFSFVRRHTFVSKKPPNIRIRTNIRFRMNIRHFPEFSDILTNIWSIKAFSANFQ